MSGSGRTPGGQPYFTSNDAKDPEEARAIREAIPDSGPELIQPGDEIEPSADESTDDA